MFLGGHFHHDVDSVARGKPECVAFVELGQRDAVASDLGGFDGHEIEVIALRVFGRVELDADLVGASGVHHAPALDLIRRRLQARLQLAIDEGGPRRFDGEEIGDGEVILGAFLAVFERNGVRVIDRDLGHHHDALFGVFDFFDLVERAFDNQGACHAVHDLNGCGAMDMGMIPIRAFVVRAVFVDIPAVLRAFAWIDGEKDVIAVVAHIGGASVSGALIRCVGGRVVGLDVEAVAVEVCQVEIVAGMGRCPHHGGDLAVIASREFVFEAYVDFPVRAFGDAQRGAIGQAVVGAQAELSSVNLHGAGAVMELDFRCVIDDDLFWLRVGDGGLLLRRARIAASTEGDGCEDCGACGEEMGGSCHGARTFLGWGSAERTRLLFVVNGERWPWDGHE